ncbi:MAG: matrixin family metalloprotease [Bacillota bacterium]
MEHTQSSFRWNLEALESRVLLSLASEADVQLAAATGEAATAARAIRMDVIVLHELGHTLGLDHDTSDAVSIMDPYYNDQYDINYFLSGRDPAVAKLRQLYADVEASGWKDSLDGTPGDGCIELTYSFVPDGTRMDQGISSAFKSFDALYGSAAAWKKVIVKQLERWAAVSDGNLAFSPMSDSGAAFGTRGNGQNDPRFGDIRIGAHRFDGPAKVLAHAYYPPPNGETAAGDLHLDVAENWDGMQGTKVAKPAQKAEKQTKKVEKPAEKPGEAEGADQTEMVVRPAAGVISKNVRVGASLFAGRAEAVLGEVGEVLRA